MNEVKKMEDLKIDVAKSKKDIEFIKTWMQNQSQINQDVTRLVSSVEVMVSTLETVIHKQDEQNERIRDLEFKPLKQWQYIKYTLIGCIITGAFSVMNYFFNVI